MYPSTSIQPICCEAGSIFALFLLDYRQKLYTYHLLCLSNLHLTKKIPPISLRKGDGKFRL